MSRQRVQMDIEADGLVSKAEGLTVQRLLLTKDIDLPHQVRAQRINEINEELRRIENHLAELKVGG